MVPRAGWVVREDKGEAGGVGNYGQRGGAGGALQQQQEKLHEDEEKEGKEEEEEHEGLQRERVVWCVSGDEGVMSKQQTKDKRQESLATQDVSA